MAVVYLPQRPGSLKLTALWRMSTPQIHPHDMELSTVAQLDRTMDLTTVAIDRIQVTAHLRVFGTRV